MKERFERVDKHLYKRQYQSATGEWQTFYYARFVDWQGKRRMFALGSNLQPARRALIRYEAQNVEKEDFDGVKLRMTFDQWRDRYLDLVRHKRSLERDKRSCKRLSETFGAMVLTEITRTQVMQYRNIRLTEPIIRRGKAVAGSKIKTSTINRELACLKHMLNLAADEGVIDIAPRIKLDSEKKFVRRRVVSDAEFTALLNHSARYLQRILIGLRETAMRRDEVLKLTWDKVDESAAMIRLAAEDTKEDDKRVIPISGELQAVLAELRAEQRRVPNIAKRVFTRNGKPITSIRTGFELAKERAAIGDMVIHDLRHTAITRWAAAGLPQEIAMKVSGHKSLAMHYRYVNLQEHHVKDAFKMATGWQQKTESKESSAASS